MDVFEGFGMAEQINSTLRERENGGALSTR
jgi:hypothetical protein